MERKYIWLNVPITEGTWLVGSVSLDQNSRSVDDNWSPKWDKEEAVIFREADGCYF